MFSPNGHYPIIYNQDNVKQEEMVLSNKSQLISQVPLCSALYPLGLTSF